MARDFHIPGECLVQVKGRSDSGIASLSELGLSDNPVTVTPVFHHDDINVDAWGEAPAEIQVMLAEVRISFTLIQFDRSVLDTCLRLSMGFPSAIGQLSRAGTRLGGNVARFVPGNNFIGLNFTSPIDNKPWRFFFAYLMDPPATFPLTTRKSIIPTQWRAVPYTTDPWQGGVGAANYALWDHILDS